MGNKVAKKLWQMGFFPNELLSKISLSYIVLIGLLCRFILAPFGTSSDFEAWRRNSHWLFHYGINIFNLHPHYPPLWWLTLRAIYPLYLILSLFSPSILLERLILKIPIIVCDIGILLVLHKVFRNLQNEKRAKLIALLWALNPYAIWISSIWGQFDAIPTLFALFALERLTSKRIKSSAVLLSISIMYKLYPIFLIPAILIPLYRLEGKQRLFEYSKTMALTCSLLAIPWNLSFLYLQGIISPPVFEPTLSYWYLLHSFDRFKSVQNYWSPIFYFLILVFLVIYFFKRNSKTLDIYELTHGILLSLLLVYLARIIFFPYYVVWSLPFLLIACLGSKKIPKRIAFLYIATPMLFNLCGNPSILYGLPSYLTNPSPFRGEPFLQAFAMNFSLLCILIIAYLLKKSPTHRTWNEESKEKKFTLLKIANIVALTCGIFLVFAPWLRNYNRTNLWNSLTKYLLFNNRMRIWNTITNTQYLLFYALGVLFISLIVVSLILHKSGSKISLKSYTTPTKISIICLLLLWIYTVIVLLVGTTLLFLDTKYSPTIALIYSKLYSFLLILWIPLIIYFISRGQLEALFNVIYFVFLQVDFLITRDPLFFMMSRNIAFQVDLLLNFCILIPLLISVVYAYPIKIQD